jgi:hypothetical protein
MIRQVGVEGGTNPSGGNNRLGQEIANLDQMIATE